MTVTIDQKIVSSSIVRKNNTTESKSSEDRKIDPINVTEAILRPAELSGKTYQIKPPVLDHSLFVTINDIELEDGSRIPFEIFINSKNMEGYQWIVGMTRMISALLRHNIDPYFLVDELKQVFDPKDSYYLPGGVFVKSIVAHLGIIFSEHCANLGLKKEEDLSKEQKNKIEEKKEELKSYNTAFVQDNTTECPKCYENSYINTGGCPVCISCGYSKCS